uniref:Uncharacterized protein n=1 Tax=Ixodes ricinus TaxID=34613 RepID=A0A6B0U9T2_IXORI
MFLFCFVFFLFVYLRPRCLRLTVRLTHRVFCFALFGLVFAFFPLFRGSLPPVRLLTLRPDILRAVCNFVVVIVFFRCRLRSPPILAFD